MKILNPPIQSLSFLEFWVQITELLGDSHGSINPKTKTTQQLFSNFDDQLGLLKEVIVNSYAANKCRHVKDQIDINLVLDVLGVTAFELKLKHADDLLDIELLEEICWLICEHYLHFVETPKALELSETTDINAETITAKVLSLPKTKIRMANSKF